MCTCVRYGKEAENRDTHRQYFFTSMDGLIDIDIFRNRYYFFWSLKMRVNTKIGNYYKHFNRQFIYAVFYIQNRMVCLRKKIRYYCSVLFFVFCFFLSCLGQLLIWNHFICHYITWKSHVSHLWLVKLGKWNNRHSAF